MKIITCNVNGVRSATSKGFWSWFADQNADVLCLQELKAFEHQFPPEAKPDGYHCYVHSAEKAGYSGVALYTRDEPLAVHRGLGAVDPTVDWSAMDAEGRFVQVDYPSFSVISAYFPSGSSSEERQAVKMQFLEQFFPYCERLLATSRSFILCGDVNIAHQKIDLKNWRGNQKNSGFLPEERAWFNRLLAIGLVDVLRELDPDREQYSWWSNRGRARANNVGWRIDYHLCTRDLAAQCTSVDVYTGSWFSDHAPVIAEFASVA